MRMEDNVKTGHTVKIICQLCGKEKLVYPSEAEKRQFCSKACANKGRRIRELGEFDHDELWERTEEKLWQCPYNVFCSCRVRRCTTCGWNPKVARARLAAFKEKAGISDVI